MVTITSKTVTTAPYTVPAKGESSTVYVADASWVTDGSYINIPFAGFFLVNGHTATSISVLYVNETFNTNSQVTVPSGTQVVPGSFIDTESPNPIFYYRITGKTALGITLSYNIVSFTQPETTPPSGTMTAPSEGATLTGVVTLSANVADNAALAYAEFQVYHNGNWVLVGTATATGTSASVSIQWDSSTMTNGVKYFAVKVFDQSGNFGWSGFNGATVSNVVLDPGNFSWLRDVAAPTSGKIAEGNSLAVDPSGNIYVAGKFQGTTLFGGSISRTSNGGYDTFLAKYSPAGNLLWVNTYGGTNGDDSANGVVTDNDGNVYLTGNFQGKGANAVSFGGTPLESNGQVGGDITGIFVAKYNGSTGAHMWSRGFKGPFGGNYSYGIACNGTDIFFVGSFYLQADVGGGTINSYGQLDGYVTKLLGLNGNPSWNRFFGSTDGDYGRAIACDGAGNVVVCGYGYGGVNFGSGALPYSGGGDILVAKYNGSNGSVMWAQQFGSGGSDTCEGVACGPNNTVYITGAAGGEINFGNGKTVSPTGPASFITKFNSDGVADWAKWVQATAGSPGAAMAVWGMDVDSNGNAALTGVAGGEVNFGNGQLTAGVGNNFLLKIRSADGNYLWHRRFNNNNSGFNKGVFVVTNEAREVFNTGYCTATTTFDNGAANGLNTITTLPSSRNVYLLKYSP